MMKKAKFLALVLVVALALMGAAYAFWTDTLNFSTVASTGEFDMQFVPAVGTAVEADGNYVLQPYDGYDDFEGAYAHMTERIPGVALPWGDYVGDADKVSSAQLGASIVSVADPDSLNLKVSNLYPGSGAMALGLSLKNNGTIGAKLTGATFVINNPAIGDTANIYDRLIFGIQVGDVVYQNSLKEIMENQNDSTKNPFLRAFTGIIERGESIPLNAVFVQMKRGTAGDVAENSKVDFTIATEWTQHNAGAPEVSSNQ